MIIIVHMQFETLQKQTAVRVKPLFHQAATVGDKLRKAFIREVKIRACSWIPLLSGTDSPTCCWNSQFKKNIEFTQHIFSQNCHRVIAVVSKPSRTILDLVPSVRKVREMWDKFVRGWCHMKLNLIQTWESWQIFVARMSHNFRVSVVRYSCKMYANSRQKLATSVLQIPIQSDLKRSMLVVAYFLAN